MEVVEAMWRAKVLVTMHPADKNLIQVTQRTITNPMLSRKMIYERITIIISVLYKR